MREGSCYKYPHHTEKPQHTVVVRIELLSFIKCLCFYGPGVPLVET